MTRLLFFSLTALVALAPLPFASNRPWSWSLLSLAVGAMLIIWAATAWRDREMIPVPARRVWFLLALFAVIAAWIYVQAAPWTPQSWHHPAWAAAAAALGEPLDGAISIDPAMTRAALMRLLSYGGVFWLALQFGRRREGARRILWTIAISGLLYSIYGMVIEFGGYDMVLWYERWAYSDSLTSTFINRNSFATYAGLTLLVTLGLTFDEFRRGAGDEFLTGSGVSLLVMQLTGRLGLLILMAATIGSALLLTGSRGGMASFAAGLFILTLGFIMAPGNRVSVGVVIVAVCAVLVAGLIALSGEVVLSRFQVASDAAVGRMALYRLLFDTIRAAPWTGVGYGTFEMAFPSVRDAAMTTPFSLIRPLVIDKAHNSYLEFAYEVGVPAFALMMGLLGAIVLVCVKGIWKRRESRLFPCIGVAAAALVASHAMVDFSVQIPAVAVLFAALLGVATAQSLTRRKRHHPEEAPTR